MKITFTETNTQTILDNIMAAMDGRALSKIVSFDLNGQELEVTISKMGKSKLIFDMAPDTSQTSFTLAKEKIALAHKAFKGEVTEKIIKVIEKAGGNVEH